MAGKTEQFESDILALIFWGTPITGIADAAASPLTSLWLSLHTSAPGESISTDQTTNEIGYLSYGRVFLTRNASNWGRYPGYMMRPIADVIFPQCSSATPVTATHFGVGSNQFGAGRLFYWGPLSPVIAITKGIVPILTNSTSISED